MEIGTIRPVDIERQMQEAYLDYAMSVIVARALPDARDGLKPVQRRILYAMYDMGLRHNRPYRKSARIVGEVLGKYHPHGDAAVYDAMARMAQDFSMRYPLVDGQGNFGSVDGDSPAAMRYTEARLHALAEELLEDLDKDTVDWSDNFDGSLKEPSVLPGRLPNLLLNGATGIAVGMATSIPPHNLGELADAAIYLIDHHHQLDEISVDDLLAIIPGPDFPTGALILGQDSIRNAYATGQGRLVMRAVTSIEQTKSDRYRIVVSELPYLVNKASLIEKIAELVRTNRINDISDLRDESDRSGLQIVIELKRGSHPHQVLNQLFKLTPLQTTFGVNILALVDGEPRRLSLKRALWVYIKHRQGVLIRRTRFELDQAQARSHILAGLRLALEHLDQVIATIRQSPDAETARQRLIKDFGLSEAQAQAILDMPLRRLAALERQRIEDEYQELQTKIGYLEGLLADPDAILALIKADLLSLKERYGDPRRTKLVPDGLFEGFSEEDLIPRENVLIAITQRSYVKRLAAHQLRPQARGGRGVTGITTREEDAVQLLFAATTLDSILYFTNRGRVFQEKAHQIPDASRQGKGLPLSNLIQLDPDEQVTAAVAVPDFAAKYLTMLTLHGRIKRVALVEFESVRPSGLIAINLEEGDELGWVRLTRGDQELIVVTEEGQAIRFPEEQIRPMGRAAAGVMAIQLAPSDLVASMDVVEPEAELLVVTSKGYGKRTPLTSYPTQGRSGAGVRTISRDLETVGRIAAARVVCPDDEIILISAEGMVLRTAVAQIPLVGRPARGSRVMQLVEDDQVVSVARLEASRLKELSSD